MKHFRILPPLLLALLLALLLCLPAAALGASAPQGNEAQEQSSSADLVWLSDSVAFNVKTRRFAYPVPNSGVMVYATVADGMIVTNSVSISGATVLIYRNGEAWEGNRENINESGEYVVMGQSGSQTPRLFTFTLAKTAVSSVYAYRLPAGMEVVSATRDDTPISFDRYNVPMQEDGRYRVEYECFANSMTYSLDLTVDRTPPELRFEGEIDERNRVHSALRFSGLGEGETVKVTLDGQPLDFKPQNDGTGELKQSGSYVITAFDPAGNRSEYAFTVLIYLEASGAAFFLLLFALIIALFIYVRYKRKHLEIG